MRMSPFCQFGIDNPLLSKLIMGHGFLHLYAPHIYHSASVVQFYED